MSCDHDEFQIRCSLQKWYVLDMHYLSVLLQVERGEISHILNVYTNLVHELNPVLAARDNICPPLSSHADYCYRQPWIDGVNKIGGKDEEEWISYPENNLDYLSQLCQCAFSYYTNSLDKF